jgi:DNA-binding XRE family transcriptional regulator
MQVHQSWCKLAFIETTACRVAYQIWGGVSGVQNDRWNKAVAAVVSASRRDADISQEILAEKMELSRNTLVRIESGKRPMTIPELMRFAKVLKLSPTVLIDLIVRWHR